MSSYTFVSVYEWMDGFEQDHILIWQPFQLFLDKTQHHQKFEMVHLLLIQAFILLLVHRCRPIPLLTTHAILVSVSW